ncbi:hypothetical protein AFL01nite_04800 [Aeromicrobium flavum]|uniref:Uncharacterized protein n=1 Tax=Aeromicrobium flavum TaxID=416568 RepID=A0A512HRS1_9ACTN|nr:hypothetical protein [Aeromicrobium flavum]GEO88153.1 hypothetical protein AFL01nite_04800 [Aeromicrobium flavum]
MVDRNTVSARRPAPSDPELLGLFCQLVEEYDRLGAAFPISVTSFELTPENYLDDTERWHRVVRAMALRKFVLGHQDHVRADKVLSALRNCLRDPADAVVLERWSDDFRSIGAKVQIDEGADARSSLTEVLEDLIYGSYLHGDLDRWKRTTSRWQASVDLALWMFSEDAEYYIRRLRTVVLVAAREGRLTDEATASVQREATSRPLTDRTQRG